MKGWRHQKRCGYHKRIKVGKRRLYVMTDTYRHNGRGKVRILSPLHAAEAIGETPRGENYRGRPGMKLGAYWCEWCQSVHVGHQKVSA